MSTIGAWVVLWTGLLALGLFPGARGPVAVLVVIGALTLAGCDNTADLELQAQACPDTMFSTGYMVRLPHEPHSAERCVQVQRRAPPRFVPDVGPFLHDPIRQTKQAAR